MVLKYLGGLLENLFSVPPKQPNYTFLGGDSYYLKGQENLIEVEKFLRKEFEDKDLMSEYEIIKEEDNDTEPRLFIDKITPEGKSRVFSVRYDPLTDLQMSKEYYPTLFYRDMVSYDPKIDDILNKASKILYKSLYK